jgi:16S rRNA (adenine1518-N6/adenine1519-N6)-dimethyltransferase
MNQNLPQAKKALGQHFLVDQHYIQRIVAAIRPAAGERMVEIGPGPGALTRPLLDVLEHLDVVELDRDMVARLEAEFPPDRLTIHRADALGFPFGDLGPDLRVVGNLPYNISSPLLFHLAESAPRIRDMCFMLQKEVVDRMAAAPATPDYGRLSVMLQARFRVGKLFTVPPGAFRPPPKVDSAIVRLVPLGAGGGALPGSRRVRRSGGARLRPAPQDPAQYAEGPGGRGGVRVLGHRSGPARGNPVGGRVRRIGQSLARDQVGAAG